MLNLPHSVRVFLHTRPTNLRKSFDGLAARASASLELDPLSGHLFIFLN